MKRDWIDLNNLRFNIEDIKDMTDLDLMVLSNECDDFRREFVNAELGKRQDQMKKSHLKRIK